MKHVRNFISKIKADRFNTGLSALKFIYLSLLLAIVLILAKVSLQQSGKCLTMSSLIPSHFMHGIVDRIEIQCLCTFCKVKFSGSSTVFSSNS